MSDSDDDEEPFPGLPLESAFILNGMFALSARFSTSKSLSHLDAKDRGTAFAKRAEQLYERQLRLETFSQPSLPFLQGCLLLAAYYLGAGVCSRAWLITGVCSRLAYDLRLHTLDDDVISGGKHLDGKDWIEREERRRTWWSSWELDNFASTVSGRPYGHDKGQLQVLLPVSDEAWFSNTPIASAPLHTDTLKVWKSLERCQNQDERAWFLLSIYLVRLSYDISRSPGYPQNHKDIKTAIDCFALVLPRKFDLSNGGLLFDQRNWRNSCWIIGTNLMVQGYVQFLFHFLSMLLVTDA
jgi:hypothetical protein